MNFDFSIFENKRIRNATLFTLLLLMITINLVDLRLSAKDGDKYVLSAKEDAIMATFLDNGYSLAGACGIMGNMSVENPKFEADLEANGGITYGLFQWNDVGERRSNLVKWCNNRKLYPNRTEGQLAFAMYEIEGGDPLAKRLEEFLKTTTDPEQAAMEFAVGFERCIGSTGNDDIDGVYTGTYYPDMYGNTYQALAKRVSNAKDYYRIYSGSELDPALALKANAKPTAGLVAEHEDSMLENCERLFTVNDENVTFFRLFISAVICLIIGYICGNALGTAIIAKAVKKKSIYKTGNKIPSLVNVLKFIGIKAAVLSLLVDISKFYVALGLAYLLTGGVLHRDQILWVGLGIILGNDYPFWAKFKGGMGIVATLTLLYVYMPIWGFQCMLVGTLIAILTKSFPQGAIVMTIIAVPYAFANRGIWPGIVISLVMLTMLIRHYRTIFMLFDKVVIKKYYALRQMARREFLIKVIKAVRYGKH